MCVGPLAWNFDFFRRARFGTPCLRNVHTCPTQHAARRSRRYAKTLTLDVSLVRPLDWSSRPLVARTARMHRRVREGAKMRKTGTRKLDFPNLKICFSFLARQTTPKNVKRQSFDFWTVRMVIRTQAFVDGWPRMFVAARGEKTSKSVLRAFYGPNYAASITEHCSAENARKPHRERAKELLGGYGGEGGRLNVDDLFSDV